jgi:hypothetical protein
MEEDVNFSFFGNTLEIVTLNKMQADIAKVHHVKTGQTDYYARNGKVDMDFIATKICGCSKLLALLMAFGWF